MWSGRPNVLVTVLVEVEATLNSRPISYLSSEDLDEPLSPSHLLIGHHVLSIQVLMTDEEDPNFIDVSTRIALTRRMHHLNQVWDHFWERRVMLMVGKWSEVILRLLFGNVVLIYDVNQSWNMWHGQSGDLDTGVWWGSARGVPLRTGTSGSKSTLLRWPIQHLYPLETSVPALPVQQSAAVSDRATEFSSGEVASCPKSAAAQLARHQLRELIGIDYTPHWLAKLVNEGVSMIRVSMLKWF